VSRFVPHTSDLSGIKEQLKQNKKNKKKKTKKKTQKHTKKHKNKNRDVPAPSTAVPLCPCTSSPQVTQEM
jgi:hypothetical protein